MLVIFGAGGDSGSFGPMADIKTPALHVLSLLLDHKKLVHQRIYSLQCRAGKYSYMLIQSPFSSSSLFSPLNHSKVYISKAGGIKKIALNGKQMPPFKGLHTTIKPPNSHPEYRLKLTEPTRQSKEAKEDMDEDDDTPDISTTDSSVNSYTKNNVPASFDGNNGFGNSTENNGFGNSSQNNGFRNSTKNNGFGSGSGPFNHNNDIGRKPAPVPPPLPSRFPVTPNKLIVTKAPIDFLDDSPAQPDFFSSPVLMPSSPPIGKGTFTPS
eukprot:CAMPEP_0119050116 /NCGR_PEP_ID=MMETSP1177-20130426/68259_1 /TAXON_ID=2985 /ORGANISM="Ochromonas sp, Strain CCMP1899" /LENGTH=266 /DNA_ID=CAMNT_0007028141 /DNA_START=182 /DNA_END=979 /DNA_ORIENTATION=-